MKKTILSLFLILAAALPMAGCGGNEWDISYEENVSEETLEVAENPETLIDVEEETPKKIYVSVLGEVANPGVFILDEGARVFEAINAAGGTLENANINAIPLVEVLKDGSQIVVQGYDDNQAVASMEASFGEADSKKVNINTATQSELITLSGIGTKRAGDIIAYRNSKGSFEKIEDIMNVSGIKESVFEKIKDSITVN